MQDRSQDKSPKPRVDWRSYIGFGESLAQLAKLLTTEQLPQVLLFTGREGLGKSVLALATAGLHVCTTASACGACAPCRLLQAGLEHNVLVVDGEGGPLKVEDADRIQEHLSIKAGHTHTSPWLRRIVILVDADHLTIQACNRLLKTIEEPPAGSRILLTSSRPKNLLPTLVSRCVRWPVQPPPRATTLAWARSLAGAEGYAEAELTSLIERAALSPGKVYASLQQQGQGARPAEDLLTFFKEQPLHALLANAEELVRQKSWSAQDIAREAEYALNLWYKKLLHSPETRRELVAAPILVKRRRLFLRRLKQTAGKQRITLNAQLAAEQLGLFQHLF